MGVRLEGRGQGKDLGFMLSTMRSLWRVLDSFEFWVQDINEEEQDMPPPSIPIWHKNYFVL